MSLEINKSEMDESVQDGLFRKGLILESMIKKRAPVYTGDYRASWTTIRNNDGTVTVGTPQGGKGKALEFGGESGNWPPVDALRQWVRRKIAPEPEELDSTTYLIGRKIFEEGINPQPHLRPAIREFKRRE